MVININTDSNIHGSEKLNANLTDTITGALSHYSNHISRVEAHITDENGSKAGVDDKRCVLEAHVEGKPPVAVTSHGNTLDQAVNSAIGKMNHALESLMGKMKDNRHAVPIDTILSDN